MKDRPSKEDYRCAVVAGWCWLAMVVIGLLCSCTAQGAERLSGDDIKSTVCRVTNQLRGATNIGSGTLIDKTDDGREGLVLTCAHLFSEGTGSVVVEFAGGKRHSARVLQIDRQADLAALLIGNPANNPAAVVLEMSEHSQLHACGYGPRGFFRCAVGRQVGQATSPGMMSLLINDPVRSGDSGGGVFDEQGRLVAVIWGESQGVTYASYGRPLQKFLGRVLGHRTSVVYSCPSGGCRQQPQVRQRPTAIKPWPDSAPIRGQPQQVQPRTPQREESILVDSRWSDFQRQIDQLRNQKQDRGDYLTRDDLPTAGRAAGFELRGVGEEESETDNAFPSGGSLGRAAGTAAVGLLGLSGPAGWGVLAAASVGGWVIGRRVQRNFSGAGGRRRFRFRGGEHSDPRGDVSRSATAD